MDRKTETLKALHSLHRVIWCSAGGSNPVPSDLCSSPWGSLPWPCDGLLTGCLLCSGSLNVDIAVPPACELGTPMYALPS